MKEIIFVVISGAAGAIVGAVLTCWLMIRNERNKACRDALVKASEVLQDFSVVYAIWYVEFLSPQAQAQSGSWAKPTTGKPDPLYIGPMGEADRCRGRLRVVHALLDALLSKQNVDPVCLGIMRVLVMTGPGKQADCRDVDQVAQATCDLIPDIIRKYR